MFKFPTQMPNNNNIHVRYHQIYEVEILSVGGNPYITTDAVEWNSIRLLLCKLLREESEGSCVKNSPLVFLHSWRDNVDSPEIFISSFWNRKNYWVNVLNSKFWYLKQKLWSFLKQQYQIKLQWGGIFWKLYLVVYSFSSLTNIVYLYAFCK